MSDGELFHIEPVPVKVSIQDMPRSPLCRVMCEKCGEDVNDYREVMVAGKVLCRSCAYGCYYQCLGARRLMDIARTSHQL